MTVSFEDHLQEINALLDAALRIARDETIPIHERLAEIGRVLPRVQGHVAAAELFADAVLNSTPSRTP